MNNRPMPSTSKIMEALHVPSPKQTIEIKDANIDIDDSDYLITCHDLKPSQQVPDPKPFKSTIMKPLPNTPCISVPGQRERIYREVPVGVLETNTSSEQAENQDNSVKETLSFRPK